MKIKAKNIPTIKELEPLVGKWKTESYKGDEVFVRGYATTEWIEGGGFLIQRANAKLPKDAPQIWKDNNPLPTIAIIGLDDSSKKFYYLYADGRGVRRVYTMSIKKDVWKIQGQAGPRFFQAMEWRISRNKNKIDVKIERSNNGTQWELDFNMRYTRI